MKTCSKCGFIGEDQLFAKRGYICKICTNAKQREYNSQNKESVKKSGEKYREANRDKLRESEKKYRENNKDEIKIRDRKRYYSKRSEKLKQKKTYYEKNKYIIIQKVKKHRESEDGIRSIHLYLQSIRGKIKRRIQNYKRRKLGFDPINKYFEGAESHHLLYSNNPNEINVDLAIYVPKELHHSIWHNGKNGQGIRDINIKLLEWYLRETPVEERNKKAVDLYLKYCMLPEPVWINKQPSI